MSPLVDTSPGFTADVFVRALALGAVLGLTFTAFSLFSLVCGLRTVGRALLDTAFFVLCAAATFLLTAAMDAGTVRGYVLLGELAGFAAYRVTLGRIAARGFARLERLLNRQTEKAARRLRAVRQKVRFRLKKYLKLPQKPKQTQKKHLPDGETS